MITVLKFFPPAFPNNCFQKKKRKKRKRQ